MNEESEISFVDQIFLDGHIIKKDVKVTPLSGGVSSDIYLVDDGVKKWVVKRALAKLNVREEWFADISRNYFECEYLKYVRTFLPEAVPKVEFEGNGYFGMEYKGGEFSNWKQLMMNGNYELVHAFRAGKILGTIHQTSFGDSQVRNRFDSIANFHQLRLSPYLIATGQRNPDLTHLFAAEVARLESTSECLVHGDYSPKNILVSKTHLVVVDCEVAWYGDPAFDLAFLLTHLHLKAVHCPKKASTLSLMVHSAISSYLSARVLNNNETTEFLMRTHQLLLMLLLARIDGKSPVEYLTDSVPKRWVRQFVTSALLKGNGTLNETSDNWFRTVSSYN